jgi:hypothetical protein
LGQRRSESWPLETIFRRAELVVAEVSALLDDAARGADDIRTTQMITNRATGKEALGMNNTLTPAVLEIIWKLKEAALRSHWQICQFVALLT